MAQRRPTRSGADPTIGADGSSDSIRCWLKARKDKLSLCALRFRMYCHSDPFAVILSEAKSLS